MATDAQGEWDDYLRRSLGEIDAAWKKAGGLLVPAQPPTRAETIKMAWEQAKRWWPALATEAGLIVEHDLGIVPPIHFEQMRYGDVMVIEAEGVVVQRRVIHG